MTCYRHPDREAHVRCQRCERFICPACQNEAPVGFLCPEHAGRKPRKSRSNSVAPLTTALIAINVVVWVLQILPGSVVTNYLAYTPWITALEPWRMITDGFVHSQSNPMHLLLNMYSIYIFGRVLEPMLGRLRFAAVYLVSIFGSSVAVLWLSGIDTWVVGASGGLFGLMAAYFVVLRRIGSDSSQMLGLIAINFAFGFFIPGISWQGHLGGLLTGAAIALIYSATRSPRDQTKQTLGVIGVAIALVLIAAAGYVIRIAPYLPIFISQ